MGTHTLTGIFPPRSETENVDDTPSRILKPVPKPFPPLASKLACRWWPTMTAVEQFPEGSGGCCNGWDMKMPLCSTVVGSNGYRRNVHYHQARKPHFPGSSKRIDQNRGFWKLSKSGMP